MKTGGSGSTGTGTFCAFITITARSIPAAKPTPGVCTPAQKLDQAVVATAATERGLRADALGPDLEDGLGVVVEPAHEFVVDGVEFAQVVQVTAQCGEVFGAIVADVVEHLGRAVDDRLALILFAIEDAQRVLVDAPLAVVADDAACASRSAPAVRRCSQGGIRGSRWSSPGTRGSGSRSCRRCPRRAASPPGRRAHLWTPRISALNWWSWR